MKAIKEFKFITTQRRINFRLSGPIPRGEYWRSVFTGAPIRHRHPRKFPRLLRSEPFVVNGE